MLVQSVIQELMLTLLCKLMVILIVLLLELTHVFFGILFRGFFSRDIVFLSRVSTLTRDIDIANLSVRLSVGLSVRDVPV